jgi:two-component system chemotaxis sensor kinase CheA
LHAGAADAEGINAIFRAAHSIKGGSGTFGLMDVSDFTHVMETLLDEMRDGRRVVTVEAVNVLLRSVDVLREMLIAAHDGDSADHGGVKAQRVQLEQVLARGHGDARRAATATVAGGPNSIRVDVQKIDGLINQVGELVLTQSMLSMLGDDFDFRHVERLREGLAQLQRQIRELQESVRQIRMVPIGFSFSRLPRLVHDLSGRLGKQIELQMSGESTEVDKTVIEKIGDPLVHLVRNSLDHGIERPEERLAAGKPEIGTLHVSASHSGGNVVIEIRDDGRGLRRDKILEKAIERGMVKAEDKLSDKDVYELVFQPGFSTADQVSDVSGRGVGMDVVRRNVNALGGVIEIDSTPGEGSVVIIRLPPTTASLDCQTMRINSTRAQVKKGSLAPIAGAWKKP